VVGPVGRHTAHLPPRRQRRLRFHFSATLWTWRESCGDPHKAGEARAGQVPFVWGAFDVDCRTNTVAGVRTPLLDQLRRGVVRAAPGRLVLTAYDATTRTLRTTGEQAAPGTRLHAWYPSNARIDHKSTFGLRRIDVTRDKRGGIRITARATGGDWQLMVHPA
jgi:hypothetical protein